MPLLNDKKLLNLIRYAPVAIVGVFVIAVNLIVIHDNRQEAELSIQALRDDVISRHQVLISQQVNQVVKEIQLEKNRTVEVLKQNAKQRVEEAHAIALNIYNSNQDKSKQEITRMIADALRPIRFYEGRGYFFIFQMDGVNVMHALRPQLEGTSAWEATDIRGTPILREHIRLIRELGGEAFYNWWYQKPGYPPEQEFEKIGFGKRFEPYDWFIGTGEYVVDVEHDIQQNVLNRLAGYEFSNNGYIYILDSAGTTLSHKNKDFIGLNIADFSNQEMNIENIRAVTRDGGGFIRYSSPYKPDASGNSEKISYVKEVDDWGWVVGSGFYLNDFERYLSSRQKDLQRINQVELFKIIGLSLVSTILMVGLSLFVSSLIAKRFDKFQHRIAEDFDKLEHTKDKMQHMAQHDALTGLPNRVLLLDKIRAGIEYAKENERQLAVMFVDLDDFKKVNDLYGHTAGDKLLETISRKFETILGSRDTVSRFGGDEFIFCFPDLDNMLHTEQMVGRIREVFQDQFVIDGKILETDCSIGVAMYPSDGENAESLIRKADIVLYKSKALRKGHVMFYSEEINDEVRLDYVVEEELRRAIYKDEISVLYQPQIEADNGHVIGVEALARWSNLRLGMVAPTTFIKVAEDTGLIHDIGLFVFRRACEDILAVSPNGERQLHLSVNISPKQLLEPDFPEFLSEIVADVGIDVNRITLEITENVFLNDLNKVEPVLSRLRSIGFGISLDDFGTGYSSLSYLNSLPISEIKIDRCFIDKLLVNEQSDNLVKAIIAIGKSCDLKVVAEGVETQQQYNKLVEYDCRLLQGYYFDRPLPIQKISLNIAGQESA